MTVSSDVLSLAEGSLSALFGHLRVGSAITPNVSARANPFAPGEETKKDSLSLTWSIGPTSSVNCARFRPNSSGL